MKDFIKAIFPVTFNQYWYFTAYTGVFIFSPWLNQFVQRLNKKNSVYFSIIVFGVFSCYSTLAEHLGGNPFNTESGYSFVWLGVLYMLGAIIKKNEKDIVKVKNRNFLMIYIIMIFFSWCWKMIFGKITQCFFGVIWGEKLFVSYISPTILICAGCLLVVFSRLNMGDNLKRVIRYIAPSSFGVYLLHVQPLVFENFIKGQFVWINHLEWYFIYPVIIGMSLLIFMIGIIVDKVRMVFFRLIWVQPIANSIDTRRKRIIKRLEAYLNL